MKDAHVVILAIAGLVFLIGMYTIHVVDTQIKISSGLQECNYKINQFKSIVLWQKDCVQGSVE